MNQPNSCVLRAIKEIKEMGRMTQEELEEDQHQLEIDIARQKRYEEFIAKEKVHESTNHKN